LKPSYERDADFLAIRQVLSAVMQYATYKMHYC
jgi:hypothetical protein